MARPSGVEMDRTEMAELLSRRGDGVLSFSGDPPYSIPISFGYDVVDNRLVLQLVFGPDSRKRDFLEEGNGVSLVCYEWNSPDDWRSVVVTGSLALLPEESPDAVDAAEIFSEYATAVGLSVFDADAADLTTEWYVLDIDELRGRQSPVADE